MAAAAVATALAIVQWIGAVGSAEAAVTPISLGSAASYSVLAATGVSNTGSTVMSGDLGTSPSPSVVGFPPGTIDGNQHAADPAAQQATADFHTAYQDAASRPATGSVAGDLNGLTFVPGVYATAPATALTVTGTVTLNAQGDSNAVFLFEVGGALTTAASSSIVLTGGAQAKNVFWQVQGAVSSGASARFAGTVLAKGAITLGDLSTLTGRAFSQGAVVLSNNPIAFTDAVPPSIGINGGSTAVSTTSAAVISGTSNAPSGTPVKVKISSQILAATLTNAGAWTVTTSGLADGTYPVSASVTAASGAVGTAGQSLTIRTPTALIMLGSAATYSVVSNGIVSSTGDTVLSGDLGTSPSASVVGFPPGVANGLIHAGDAVAAKAVADARAAYQDALSRTPSASFSGDQIGKTFASGVYNSGAAFGLTGTMTLDGGGDPNAVFLFQINAAMTPAAAARMVLIGGAQASHVFWQINGALTIAAGAVMVGTFLANGAITIGAGDAVAGHLLAINGAVTLADNQVNTTTAGFLTISAPTTTVDLGSQRNTVDGETFSAALGTVTVTDRRGDGSSGWSVTVSSTDFTASSASAIPATMVGYSPGSITTTGTVTTSGTASTNLSSPVTVVTAVRIAGDNTASWSPTIAVRVPGGAVATTYASAITHSVL